MRRLPSPALVIASVALFVALGGAGFAASLALSPVRSPKPVVMVPGSVSADGKVTGARLTGGRVSAGVYTLTIRGDTFAPNTGFPPSTALSVRLRAQSVDTIPPTCAVASENIASNGSARAKVDCFAFDPAAGWQRADAAFDFQIVGPSG